MQMIDIIEILHRKKYKDHTGSTECLRIKNITFELKLKNLVIFTQDLLRNGGYLFA